MFLFCAKRLAILLTGLAIIMFGYGVWLNRPIQPVSSSLILRQDFALVRQFAVRSSASYRVAVRFDRSIPLERLESLLAGGNMVEIALQENGHPLSLSYFPAQARRDWLGRIVSISNLGFEKGAVTQEIASFKAFPERQYQIDCTVVRALDELTRTNPTLVVELDPLESKDNAIRSIIVWAIGIIFLGAGVVAALQRSKS
jgi:hypothetical protein